ncbi:DNA repair protein RecO [Desmospora activa]|uniref:DNA repair protein RecO n=1 Tax=Desmospora activa DSM 45169 TaxID=1121389 RepID=A0A2T4ZC49_9BACL|nr:DNA repair protein RecO [Desmospora activa]PTM59471.1 DNA replication and repair protein RecO [Desmospora activa DSM 45169]
MLAKCEGIVIRTRDYGESHKVVTLFTQEQGKIAVMARGAKKTKSRLGAVTQPFTSGWFLCFSGSSGMATLSQAEIQRARYSLRSDLTLTAVAAYMTELLDRLTEEREVQPVLYSLLETTLDMLEEGADPDILTHIFELKVLEVGGYRPRLDGCVHCGAVDRSVRFSVAMGGFLCLDCSHRDRQAIAISAATARVLKLLQRMTPDRVGEVDLKAETRTQLEKVIRAFLDEYVGQSLKSRDFLDRMKRDWRDE